MGVGELQPLTLSVGILPVVVFVGNLTGWRFLVGNLTFSHCMDLCHPKNEPQLCGCIAVQVQFGMD